MRCREHYGKCNRHSEVVLGGNRWADKGEEESETEEGMRGLIVLNLGA